MAEVAVEIWSASLRQVCWAGTSPTTNSSSSLLDNTVPLLPAVASWVA